MPSPFKGQVSQYQHFIPQFLLRNYAHPFVLPECQGNGKEKSKRKFGKGKHPGDPVAYNVNLQSEPLAIDESPVRAILGQTDMYRDATKPTTKEQYRIEEMFSKMESQASFIFRKIVKSFEAGDPALWLTRDERDLLRKFLFLLKYRGSMFHRRFYHDDPKDYFADDRELLRDYMRDNGFTRPTDVWFHNLETIMTVQMDPEGKWMKELLKRMYMSDAMWFNAHVQSMYMAICTPSNPADEFILTDNSYNVFEGPNHFAQDEKTGKIGGVGWANFHEFAPISPKLMLVLRSFVLPVPEEDCYPEIRKHRDELHWLAIGEVFGPDAKSLLADLPIHKARNNYSRIVNGQVKLLSHEDGKKRKDHRFCFSFFKVKTRHVNKINAILLDNSYLCSRIVFGTEENFFRTLEWYMTEPCKIGKKILGDDADARLKHITKLATLMKAMGSIKEPVWIEMPAPRIPGYEEFQSKYTEYRRLMEKFTKSDSPEPRPRFVQTYLDLGGTSFAADISQAGLMLELRKKIDSWSVGVDEAIRMRNRELLTASYLCLPPSRVWFYMKRVRMMQLCDNNGIQPMVELFYDKTFAEGPEDIFARGILTLTSPTREFVHPDRLNHLMYSTVMNDIERKKHPTLNLWQKPKDLFDFMEFKRFMAIEKFVLGLPGKIKHCGIHEIEELAKGQEKIVTRQEMHKRQEFNDLRFEDDEKIELLTRIMVRSRFKKTLAVRMDDGLLDDLKMVFFKFTYPTPPTSEDGK